MSVQEVRHFMNRLHTPYLFFLLILFAALQTGFSRGRSARVYLCAETLQRFQQETQHAIDALKPWYESEGLRRRRVASKLEKRKAKEMVARDRIVWKDWATDRLKETYHQIDALGTNLQAYGSGKEGISRVATQLVEFHAYAETGNARKMVLTLNQILLDHESASKAICAQVLQESAQPN